MTPSSESARQRAIQFGWDNIAAKVEEYYRFVLRRVASHGALPPHVNRVLAATVREASMRDRAVTPVGPGVQPQRFSRPRAGD